MNVEKVLTLSVLAAAVCALSGFAADGAPTAKIKPCAGSEIRQFAPGERLFFDRHFVISKKVALQLVGKSFVYASINGISFRVTQSGEILALTPPAEFTDKGGKPSQESELKKLGFAEVNDIPVSQLFNTSDKEKVRVWRKQVKEGERYELDYWCVIAGFDPKPAVTVKKDVPRETLYNGIVLETDPRDRTDMRKYGRYPLPVPYLDNPPAVIPVDAGRQLFVDDFLIASTTMVRTWHKAQKDPKNPVLRPETPLERGALGPIKTPMAAPFSGGVWFDATDRLYKCWYCAGWFDGTAYAYSKDGYNWERPVLKVDGKTNRIVKPETRDGKNCHRDSAAVILDPDATDGNRFKAFIWSRPQGGEIFTSANGTDWEWRAACAWSGDRSTLFYNPFRKVWCYSLRDFWSARSRQLAESKDFVAGVAYTNRVCWQRADCCDRRDMRWVYCEEGNYEKEPPEPSLYNLDCVAYESLMLGVYAIMSGADNSEFQRRGSPKLTELHLGFSRDGYHFSRPEDRSPFIPASRTYGAWDRAYLHSNAAICLVKGDELLFYYTCFAGQIGEWKDHPVGGLYTLAQMGIARLRRDGFASMDAGRCGGELVTRPIRFTRGDRLFVNANAAGGELKVEILDEDGQALAASKPFTANAVKSEILGGLSSYAGKTIRLRFTARDTQLYAFWFSDASGRSRGYLAGGSPEADGLKDE
ncbi:MAG TPA: hypothetical protein PK770_02105 [Kiritimatiellia bacterium]|nr:hypothetical protein [Kiritimatiellia bacterium]